MRIFMPPELSTKETRRTPLVAAQLRAAGYQVTTGVGKTGVVSLLHNGDCLSCGIASPGATGGLA